MQPLLDTVADCLRFVTEFFEVISQSAPHIYHSALQLAPHLTAIRKLYGGHIHSPMPRVVTGIPTSWDSCTAIATATVKIFDAVWSPCGRSIAVCLRDTVEVRDSTTLERVYTLQHPTHLTKVTFGSPAFSPDGRLLACRFDR